MSPIHIIGEIKKQQTILKVSDAELIKVTGISPATYRRRISNPETFTRGEVSTICNYLNIRTI